MILIPVLLVLVAIEGWSENGAEWNYTLLRKVLENIPGVVLIVPSYLDAKGRLAKFKSHLTIEQYAAIVEGGAILEARIKYPGAHVMVMGHSLGGVIARHLCFRGVISPENMILVGTPNLGISFGWFADGILKILASKHLCNVPVFYQMLKGSDFLNKLNAAGIPEEAYYISGTKDKVVPLWSSDPLNIGMYADCGHKLFPREEKLLEASAIPIVKDIVMQKLEDLKGQTRV